MTLLAGKLTPAANVGVAHRAFKHFSLNAVSINCLWRFVNPAGWYATPLEISFARVESTDVTSSAFCLIFIANSSNFSFSSVFNFLPIIPLNLRA